ncbi:hypothetical protein FJT64_014814 [Amphibalanus amphitrite]|uniref:Uncharacterized protein n=1 Tax=Amphibalanus amphitrite TaxID=1232801 RepID=A0A6A4V541_AMPAM|nr:hypothetical protein FJT64_014814 [Amphibalanus amphitrite]
MVGVALAFVLRSGVAVRYVTFWRDEDDVRFISAGIFFNHVKDIIQLLVLCLLLVQLARIDAQFFTDTGTMKVMPRVRRTQQMPVGDDESDVD